MFLGKGSSIVEAPPIVVVVVLVVVEDDPFPIDGRSPVLRATMCDVDAMKRYIQSQRSSSLSCVEKKKSNSALYQNDSLSLCPLSLSLRKNQIECGRKQQKYIVALCCCYIVSRRINTPLDLLTALFLLLLVGDDEKW